MVRNRAGERGLELHLQVAVRAWTEPNGWVGGEPPAQPPRVLVFLSSAGVERTHPPQPMEQSFNAIEQTFHSALRKAWIYFQPLRRTDLTSHRLYLERHRRQVLRFGLECHREHAVHFLRQERAMVGSLPRDGVGSERE